MASECVRVLSERCEMNHVYYYNAMTWVTVQDSNRVSQPTVAPLMLHISSYNDSIQLP